MLQFTTLGNGHMSHECAILSGTKREREWMDGYVQFTCFSWLAFSLKQNCMMTCILYASVRKAEEQPVSQALF